MNIRTREELLEQRAFDELLGIPTSITLWDLRGGLQQAKLISTQLREETDSLVVMCFFIEYLDPAKWIIVNDGSATIWTEKQSSKIDYFRRSKSYAIRADVDYDAEWIFRKDYPHLNLPDLESYLLHNF